MVPGSTAWWGSGQRHKQQMSQNNGITDWVVSEGILEIYFQYSRKGL